MQLICKTMTQEQDKTRLPPKERREVEELTENNLEGVEGAGSESELKHLLWEITHRIGDSDA